MRKEAIKYTYRQPPHLISLMRYHLVSLSAAEYADAEHELFPNTARQDLHHHEQRSQQSFCLNAIKPTWMHILSIILSSWLGTKAYTKRITCPKCRRSRPLNCLHH